MNLDEFLNLVHSGQARLVTHYSALEERVVLTCHLVLPEDVIEVIRQHQEDLFWLVHSNDVAVCMDATNHQPYHVPAIRGEQEYTRCDECARLRKAMEPTDEALAGSAKIDFQAERKNSP